VAVVIGYSYEGDKVYITGARHSCWSVSDSWALVPLTDLDRVLRAMPFRSLLA
jgi:hypothetical protein